MSRHQESKKGGKASGRGANNNRAKSHARGNAPIKKNTTGSSRTATASTGKGGIRLNKYIANSGICSRREADLSCSHCMRVSPAAPVRACPDCLLTCWLRVPPTDEDCLQPR